MQKISKFDFWILIKPELTYYNKKWHGDSDSEKKANERTVLGLYYTSLSHATQFTLEHAFMQHRQKETTFPKIAQILQYAPKPTQATEREKYEAVDMPERVEKTFESAKKKKKLSRELIGEMRSMVKQRWPNTCCDDTFERWNVENDLRVA